MSNLAAASRSPASAVDVAVIGAGVVGAAVARRFTLAGARVALLEKAIDPLDGASKGNSAILHTGFDAPFNSLEHHCVVEGRREYLEIRENLGLPLLETGALVLAWSDEETARLPELIRQAHENGVWDVAPVSRAEILRREPYLSEQVVAGIEVPGEHLIDPWSTPHAYLLQALIHGAVFLRSCEVKGGEWDGAVWRLHTPRGTVSARTVVNCAGLYGDLVDERLLGQRLFHIKPRKGQFLVFDKAAAPLVNAILLQTPSETTKGVVLCRTIFGNVLVGPTAEEQKDRDEASVDRGTLEALRATAIQMTPALAGCEVTASYAGIRPATERKEYRIEALPERGYISVGGVRSTGLSSALGLAHHVLSLHGGGFNQPPIQNPEPVTPPALSEYHTRDWGRPGNGGVVCHCEKATRREIEAALSGPLPARSLGGLKRRTRVGMGRCQGFYCLAEVAEMTRERFDEPITVDDVE